MEQVRIHLNKNNQDSLPNVSVPPQLGFVCERFVTKSYGELGGELGDEPGVEEGLRQLPCRSGVT
jgi:hypothetical protein